jgi:hypothetical protein
VNVSVYVVFYFLMLEYPLMVVVEQVVKEEEGKEI